MDSTAYPRALGWLTSAYGAYTLARPQSLLRAAGLDDRRSGGSRAGLALGRVIGARDTMSGLAMVLAPPGPALRAVTTARVACDAADVVGFGLHVPARSRTKVICAAGGWGLLCASSLLATGRRR